MTALPAFAGQGGFCVSPSIKNEYSHRCIKRRGAFAFLLFFKKEAEKLSGKRRIKVHDCCKTGKN
ncbi:MAG: hypothetical protein RRZ93_04330, partial [Ruthenibacterium sp.]